MSQILGLNNPELHNLIKERKPKDRQKEQHYKKPIKHHPNSELGYDTPKPQTNHNSSVANNLKSPSHIIFIIFLIVNSFFLLLVFLFLF